MRPAGSLVRPGPGGQSRSCSNRRILLVCGSRETPTSPVRAVEASIRHAVHSWSVPSREFNAGEPSSAGESHSEAWPAFPVLAVALTDDPQHRLTWNDRICCSVRLASTLIGPRPSRA